jgi:hypothetical protein
VAFLKIYYHISFYDTIVSGVRVNAASEVCSSTILVFPFAGIKSTI